MQKMTYIVKVHYECDNTECIWFEMLKKKTAKHFLSIKLTDILTRAFSGMTYLEICLIKYSNMKKYVYIPKGRFLL